MHRIALQEIVGAVFNDIQQNRRCVFAEEFLDRVRCLAVGLAKIGDHIHQLALFIHRIRGGQRIQQRPDVALGVYVTRGNGAFGILDLRQAGERRSRQGQLQKQHPNHPERLSLHGCLPVHVLNPFTPNLLT